jgi:serine/threonine-protein phosphatase 2B catalytic subunit
MEGYKMHYWQEEDLPTVVTVFSAPNYCNVYSNQGSIIKIKDGCFNIKSYG